MLATNHTAIYFDIVKYIVVIKDATFELKYSIKYKLFSLYN